MPYESEAVRRLILIGPAEFDSELDYRAEGISEADSPELIRVLNDNELAWNGVERPEIFAQIHAWRALVQLKVEAAIAPLIELLVNNDSDGEFDEWIIEELPDVLARFGPPALPQLVEALRNEANSQWAGMHLCETLGKLVDAHPECLTTVIEVMTRKLERAAENNSKTNAALVGQLEKLHGAAAWPVIEAAFAVNAVDISYCGDADLVKYKLGLGPKPPRRNYQTGQLMPEPIVNMVEAPRGPDTAKAKAAARKKKRQAKKAQRRNR
jgi:HEAT repeat protein